MKKIVILCLILCFFSCSTRKIEKQIVNDFLDKQLTTKKYTSYKGLEIIVIKEAKNGKNALSIYKRYFYERDKSWNAINNWVIDSLEITTLKSKLDAKKEFFWDNSDFKNIHPAIISGEEFGNNIRKNYYMNTPEKLILLISRPLIVKKGYALLYYDSGINRSGVIRTMESFAVLMKKTSGKWMINNYYYDDGIY